MEKALNTSERIQKAVEAYKNDDNLSIRAAAKLHNVAHQSVSNHLNDIHKPAFDQYAFYQKFTPVEEGQHILRARESGYPITIKYFNDSANEILRNRGSNERVGYY